MNPILFALATYGIAIVIAACVALIIKCIALIIQRGDKSAKANGAKQES